MNPKRPLHHGSWSRKFVDAFRGIAYGVAGQNSFWVHVPVAIAVVIAAGLLGLDAIRWCVLILCIAGVLVAELLNSALEILARAITEGHDERIGRALDIAAGGVLVAAIAAGVVGAIVFVEALVG